MLMYRFPREEIVRKRGSFRQYSSLEEISEGFILKPFGEDIFFLFEENELEDERYFVSNLPKVTSKEAYIEYANLALDDLRTGKLQKVVLSRIKSTDFDMSLAVDAFIRLEATYPNAFVYLISSPLTGTWIGATPEVLLKRSNKKVMIASLAGTKKSIDSSSWGTKECNEQQLVTNYIVEVLGGLEAKNLKINGPKELIAGPVKHLFSEITADIEVTTPDLINMMHPTPAVAGLPKKKAIDFIHVNETHNRFLYSGVIGFYSEKSANLYVNLRCAQLAENKAFLYVGGGLTNESNVEEEWDETENKARTLEKILHFE